MVVKNMREVFEEIIKIGTLDLLISLDQPLQWHGNYSYSSSKDSTRQSFTKNSMLLDIYCNLKGLL